MRIIKFLTVSFLLLGLSGCHKPDMIQEFASLNKNARDLTGHTIALRSPARLECDKNMTEYIARGLTHNQAISLALLNNPELQAHFEELGVAKADLVQAGLYTNPDIQGFFWLPFRNTATEMEIGTFFNITDLWQVPLRKKVKQDVLEATTFKILELILETIRKTQYAYDNALSAQNKLCILTDIEHKTGSLRDAIYYRYDFGLSSDLDKHLTDITVNKARIDIAHAEKDLTHAYLDFKNVLGITPTPDPITLNDPFRIPVKKIKQALPPPEELQTYALCNRPELFRLRMKIKQFKDTIALENARTFKKINAGFSFKQDFDADRGIGPSFELSLPLFDQNQAQKARAQFLLAQAEKELIATRLEIQKNVRKHYLDVISFAEELIIYEDKILPSYKKAIEYVDTYEKVMQMTVVTLLQTKKEFYEHQLRAIETNYHLLNALSELERATGKRLDVFRLNEIKL